jgi:3-phytase/alkaline phosphatase D
VVACGGAPPAPQPGAPLTFLGEAVIAPQAAVAGEPDVGGLSSIFRVEGNRYFAISDDRGDTGPARYYELEIDLSDGRLDEGDARVVGWQQLFDAHGAPLHTYTYDLEGLATLDETLFVTSEGDVEAGVEPFVAVFGPRLRLMETLGLPPGFVPSADGSTGVRNNLAFESLTITPDGRYLFTGTESALQQDGPEATPDHGTTARLLRFDRQHGVFDAQFAYPVEPVHTGGLVPGALEVNGLTELLALSDLHLLALERAFVAGAWPEHSIKLFDVCLGGATNVSAIDSLARTDTPVVPVAKRLIADLADLVPRLDNVEGMTFGPTLGGRQTLIFVSDNNFAPLRQITQVLAFALADDAIRGCSGR